MKKTGFYIIKDKFFEDMSDPYLKGNRAENRPHYYCIEDTNTEIYWMIPLSSRIDKYKRIMEKKEKCGKPCDILHVVTKIAEKMKAYGLWEKFVTDSFDEYIDNLVIGTGAQMGEDDLFQEEFF